LILEPRFLYGSEYRQPLTTGRSGAVLNLSHFWPSPIMPRGCGKHIGGFKCDILKARAHTLLGIERLVDLLGHPVA
jgi:hypothetical protein